MELSKGNSIVLVLWEYINKNCVKMRKNIEKNFFLFIMKIILKLYNYLKFKLINLFSKI